MAKADNTAQENTETEGLGYDPDAAPDNEATQGLDTEEAEGFSFSMKDEKAQTGFPVFPAGKYPARIHDLKFGHSQNSGNPMWTVDWAFTEGELGEKNRRIRSWVIFSPEQRGRAKAFLQRVAPELSELEDFNPKKIADSQVMIGKQATLKINIRPNQEGVDQNNVADVLAPTAGGSGGSFNL